MAIQRIKHFGFILGAAGGALVLGLIAFIVYLDTTLPTVTGLENPEYSLPTTIYDRNGTLVKEVFVKRRKLVTYEQVPPHLIQALIAKEDSRFFDHHGIDPLRMIKAAWVNLVSFDTVQGASTLTQQTARQFFLTLEKTWTRKISEILLALKIEREFAKQEILTLYLNKVNFGDAWGVEAAAEYYFEKTVEDLTLAECATLVGLLPAPNRYKPTRNPRLARQQRNIVLQRMAEEGFISPEQEMAAASEPMVIANQQEAATDPTAYYVEWVRRHLLAKYGSKNLYEGGLHVYTAMDLRHQVAAHQSLFDGLLAIDRRSGYRGAEDQIELDAFGQAPMEVAEELNPAGAVRIGGIVRGVVLSVDKTSAKLELGGARGTITWERMKSLWPALANPERPEATIPLKALEEALQPGDIVQAIVEGQDLYTGEFRLDLYQEPGANGAVYSINPRSGEVLAMVGGWRFGRGLGASEFIRATQALRQPGSAFKPIIYAAAIDEGYTPATILDDSPRVFTLESGAKHIPKNYDDTYMGRTSLREALFRSRNVPTVQLVDEMGANKVIEYARKLGFTTPIPPENIIALGTHSVKLDELVRAYGVFNNHGELTEPVYILRVEDAKGNVLERAETQSAPVISDATAYLVTDMLRDVVRRAGGTANTVMAPLGRPAAGKTGTTQNYTDAWYIGFIPQLVTGVYVGYDDPSQSLGAFETGSKAAAPIWLQYIQGVERSLPIEPFEQPPSVIAHRVDGEGRLISGCESSGNSRFEIFKAAAIPPRLQEQGNCFRPQVTTNGATTPSVREDPDL